MHGLQEIIRINASDKQLVIAAITNSNHSAKVRATRDAKADKQRKAK